MPPSESLKLSAKQIAQHPAVKPKLVRAQTAFRTRVKVMVSSGKIEGFEYHIVVHPKLHEHMPRILQALWRVVCTKNGINEGEIPPLDLTIETAPASDESADADAAAIMIDDSASMPAMVATEGNSAMVETDQAAKPLPDAAVSKPKQTVPDPDATVNAARAAIAKAKTKRK